MMARWICAGLLVLFVLLPRVGHAQGPADPPLLEVAEIVSACMTKGLKGQIIGMTWVEPTDTGYRVAMQIAYPGRWVGPVFAWVDLERVPGQIVFSRNEIDDGYTYAVVSRDYTYIGRHGSHREPTVAFWAHRCMKLLVWQP